jgi:hypothetical protein
MAVEVSAEESHEEAQTKEGEKEHKVEATCSLVLMPGSLLVFKDSAYTGKIRGFVLGIQLTWKRSSYGVY